MNTTFAQIKMRNELTRHRVCFSTSSDTIAEEKAISSLYQTFNQRLGNGREALVLGGVDIENMFEYVLSFLVAYDLVIDGAFRRNQSNGARRHDSDA